MQNLHVKITTVVAITVGVACGGTAVIAWHAAQPLFALGAPEVTAPLLAQFRHQIAMAAGLPGEQHLDSVTAPVATADDKAADAAEGEPKPEKQTSAPEAEAGQAPAQDGSAAQHEAEVDQAPAQGERAAQHEHDPGPAPDDRPDRSAA